MQSQFDYDYPDTELRAWVNEHIRTMAEKARRGVIFFNNHVRGQAPRNAQALLQLLQDEDLQVR